MTYSSLRRLEFLLVEFMALEATNEELSTVARALGIINQHTRRKIAAVKASELENEEPGT